MEADRTVRQATIESNVKALGTDFYHLVPHLARGVRLERKLVIADGEFVWGNVIATSSWPEGTPVSSLIAQMAALIDGNSSIADIMAKLCEGLNENQYAEVQSSVATAIQILYVDGSIDKLVGNLSPDINTMREL